MGDVFPVHQARVCDGESGDELDTHVRLMA